MSSQPTTRFLPYSIQVETDDDATDFWINQIENTTSDPGIALYEETTGSETDTQFVAAKELRPTMRVSTSDLTTLTNVGMAGVFLQAQGGDDVGAVVYGRALPQGGLPAAIGTSAHLSCAISDGMIIPISISSSNNEIAKLNLVIHGVLGTTDYSGATPFVWTASQVIPTGASATTYEFCGGPVKYTQSGGSDYLAQGISMSAVQFGIQPLKETSDGLPYPNQIALVLRGPKFEFTTKDPSIIASIDDGISVSAFAGYFRNISENGQRIAPGTDSHIKISGTAGMITPGSLNLSHARSGEASFIYTPSYDGTNPIIAISAASVIPTS